MRYTLIFIGFVAALTLSGCSFENAPAAEKKKTDELALDKLDSATSTPTTTGKQDPKATAPTPPLTPTPQTPNTMPTKQYTAAPAMTIDAAKKYTATLSTEKGDIVVALDPKVAPLAVNNFVFLAKEKFYDGTIFHRTITGFMIQGGDPEGTGRGGPGYRFADEPVTGEYKRGTIAMANAGPNTNGSQFFIMHADYALPKNYTIFGQVTSGLEVVDAIATAPTQPGGEGSSPVTPVTVQSVDIHEK